jgi:succinate-acetate transporter protein
MFIAFTAFYICWGIYHHILTKTLRLKIMLEYMLIGFAIIFLALTLANY